MQLTPNKRKGVGRRYALNNAAKSLSMTTSFFSTEYMVFRFNGPQNLGLGSVKRWNVERGGGYVPTDRRGRSSQRLVYRWQEHDTSRALLQFFFPFPCLLDTAAKTELEWAGSAEDRGYDDQSDTTGPEFRSGA
jgi:hypothetical protein